MIHMLCVWGQKGDIRVHIWGTHPRGKPRATPTKQQALLPLGSFFCMSGVGSNSSILMAVYSSHCVLRKET